MKRLATAVLLSSSVLIPAVILGRGIPAQAATKSVTTKPVTSKPVTTKPVTTKPVTVQPVTPAPPAPLSVSVSTPTLAVTGTVPPDRSITAVAASRTVSLWFRYPGSAAPTRVGGVTSRKAGALAVTAYLDAARITMGVNTIQVRNGDQDAASDGGQLMLDIRRISRVTLAQTARTATAITLAVQVNHYDPKQAAFIASRLSPVRIQENVAGSWVNVTRVVTDAQGQATATIPAAAGAHTYRAVRPNGATVWSATSAPLSAS